MRAVAAAALLVLSTLPTGCGNDTATETTAVPDPPKGMRWVGMNDVVVAVPDWWTTGETRCGAPLEDTVYFDNTATYDCQDPVSATEVAEVSSLAVIDASRGTGEYLTRGMKSSGEVAGREILELPGCNEWFEGVCRRLFAVPAAGVLFAVSISDPDDADYEEIRDSVRMLPSGLTTVPLATAADGWTPAWGAEPEFADQISERIEASGLVLRRQEVTPKKLDASLGADLPAGSLLDIEPSLGSVVEEGATVTITVLAD